MNVCLRILALFMGSSLMFLSCDFPHDPEGSWGEAQTSGLKAGVATSSSGNAKRDSLAAVEKELINRFARSENLQIEWIQGSETELVEMMKKYELHIIAGAFKKNTVWKKKVGLSHTYDKEHVFLVARGENRLVKHLERYILKRKQ